MPEKLLEIQNISKHFPGVDALREVDVGQPTVGLQRLEDRNVDRIKLLDAGLVWHESAWMLPLAA